MKLVLRNVTLTATVSIDNEPVEGVTVSFYRSNTVIGTAVTDSNGQCTYTVENLALGDYWYHAVYSDFSSNNVEVVSRKKNSSLSITTNANSIYYNQSVQITGILRDEFNTPITGATIKLFQNGSQVATATTNSNGNYTFTRQYTTVGTYNFTVQYDGNSDHNSIVSNTKSLTVNKAPVTINIQSGASSYTRGDTILIGVSSNYGSFTASSISVKFNGVTSTVTTKDSQGNFVYTLPSNIENDSIILTATYAGDSHYNPAVANSSIVISVVDAITLSFYGASGLILNFKKYGSNVANTQLNDVRLYLTKDAYADLSGTTDNNGNIAVSGIVQSGHSYYATYKDITSNTVTT